MKFTSSAAAVMGCVVLAAAPAHVADLNAARAFVVQLYAHYPQRNAAPAFDPTGRAATRVFDPTMVALFREDARLTPPGEVGAIDGDPLCDCQDDAGMSVKIEAVHLAGPSRATVRVAIRFSEASPPETRRLQLDLVSVGTGWRVYDIHGADTPSLRAYLTRSVRSAKAHR